MVGDTPAKDSGADFDALAAFDYPPAPAENASYTSELDAFDPVSPGVDSEGADGPVFTVTNPPGTVTVTTYLDGRVQHIDLSNRVTNMTERDLAEEIVVIAGLASQDAKSAQYEAMLQGMREHGHDDHSTREFLQRDLDLPTPEQARARRAEVFATRYAGSHE